MLQRWAVEDSLAQRFAIRRIRDLRSFQGCKNKPSPDSYRDWFFGIKAKEQKHHLEIKSCYSTSKKS